MDSILNAKSTSDFLVGNKTLDTDLAENRVSHHSYVNLPTSTSKSKSGKKISLDLPSGNFYNHLDTHSRRKQWQNQRKFVPVFSEDKTSLCPLKETFNQKKMASKSLDQIYSTIDEIHTPKYVSTNDFVFVLLHDYHSDVSITNKNTRCHIEQLSRFSPLSIPDEPLYDDPFYNCIDDTAYQKSSSLPDVSAGSKYSSESAIFPPNTERVIKNAHPLLVQYKAESLPDSTIKEAHYDDKMITFKRSSLPPIACRIGGCLLYLCT